MRKLILLALGGAAAAYVVKSRGATPAPVGPSTSGYVPGPDEPHVEAAATADTVESDALPPEGEPEQGA
jgi:hypothetical protein